jgi:hypothetical protein
MAKKNKTLQMLAGGALLGLPGAAIAGSMKRGGKARKTGVYKLHKGEQVVPAHKSHRTLDR